MTEKRFTTMAEFYPYYLREHSNRTNRRLHFIGTLLSIIGLGWVGRTGNIRFLIILPLIGYGFAWIGHYLVEKNKPATFKYPLLSFCSDFKLFFHMLIGKIKF